MANMMSVDALPGLTRPSLKIIVIGSGRVGKTSLLTTIKKHEFPEYSYPTSDSDIYTKTYKIDCVEYELSFQDTPGTKDFNADIYHNTLCVLILYSIESCFSYEEVEKTWAPKVRRHSRKVPIILIATKTDLREDINMQGSGLLQLKPFKTKEDGLALKQKIKAKEFFECSAKNNLGLAEIVRSAASLSILHARNLPYRYKKEKCLIT